MTKILYLSNFDCSGYGVAATQNVIAMYLSGLDVTARHIALNNKPIIQQNILQKVLNKPNADFDICVQHTLPQLFDYNGDFAQNILLFALETNELPFTTEKYVKLPDKIWVINHHSKKVLENYRKAKDIQIVPHPIDLNRFTRKFSEKGIVGRLKDETDAFVFYSVGEAVSRKNYESLLRAYFTEFTPSDNTILVIKTNKDGMNSKECRKLMVDLIQRVKDNTKLKYFPIIELITEFLPQEQLDLLHYESDCFVTCSHGEAWNLPLADASGFNKTPIASACMGHLDIVTKTSGFLCEGINEPCYATQDFPDYLYSSRENWFSVSINEVRKAMRIATMRKIHRMVQKRKAGFPQISQFSYDNVGTIIKNHLNSL